LIRIEGLRKRFGDIAAVDGLDLTVAEGSITALLGPNGAGKTTTIHCIVGLLQPDDGRVLIDGLDAATEPQAVKQQFSYVPEVASLYQVLTPDELLTLKGRLFGLDEQRIAAGIERLLAGFGLAGRRHEPMIGFSKGMTQKVALASALLTEPKALILDEPLSGLDVETTLIFKEVLREFARAGGAVLYSSHLLDVVERVADRVAVLDRGKLRALGSMAELRAQAGGKDQRLEELFRQLTAAGDPVQAARAILGKNRDRLE
jgi:ABC-2 type transport system ATP-binding protein